MLQRLQVQLVILLTTFVLLVGVSASLTFWGLQTQQQDALVINLAGRQRMLIQQMTRLALQLQGGDESALGELRESERMFGETLSALQNGGEAPYLEEGIASLPATRDPQILAALQDMESNWLQYRSMLGTIAASPSESGLLQDDLGIQSKILVQKTDAVVRLYEAASIAKVNRLRLIQFVFLISALALLAVGAWITRRSLLKPLLALGVAAKRLGKNQLDGAVQVQGPEEMRVLSQAF
ncbi:MAG TPA: type IV pili methyl-accepting chemotaxis transducer N-terminal domain-containing protein, partial [Anaerolineales bacterium]|nr:type IV pili methyl-accepting chemotaxis transducer N-terminal domain-containing protein [Anaerolineales bacterium]